MELVILFILYWAFHNIYFIYLIYFILLRYFSVLGRLQMSIPACGAGLHPQQMFRDETLNKISFENFHIYYMFEIVICPRNFLTSASFHYPCLKLDFPLTICLMILNEPLLVQAF